MTWHKYDMALHPVTAEHLGMLRRFILRELSGGRGDVLGCHAASAGGVDAPPVARATTALVPPSLAACSLNAPA